MSKASGQAARALDVHFGRERRIDLILSVAPSSTTWPRLYDANLSASCKLGLFKYSLQCFVFEASKLCFCCSVSSLYKFKLKDVYLDNLAG